MLNESQSYLGWWCRELQWECPADTYTRQSHILKDETEDDLIKGFLSNPHSSSQSIFQFINTVMLTSDSGDTILNPLPAFPCEMEKPTSVPIEIEPGKTLSIKNPVVSITERTVDSSLALPERCFCMGICGSEGRAFTRISAPITSIFEMIVNLSGSPNDEWTQP